MRIYNNTEDENSWGLKLEYDQGEAYLYAVDSRTGERIATLLVFANNGDIYPMRNALDILKKKGYNPYEHNNSYITGSGEILIGKK